MLVTVARYRAITGDTITGAATVTARIEEATELLEDELDRPLASAERTERMHPTRDGFYLPHAIPITDGGDYTIDGYTLKSASAAFPVSFLDPEPEGTLVTYTGGWVERTANEGAANALPAHIERDIAWAAYQLGQTGPVRTAAGIDPAATSVTLGDASISFGNRRRRAPSEANITWSNRTLGYRYSRLSGYR